MFARRRIRRRGSRPRIARLITIPISHYCERARWALEHVGVAYTESAHLQMLHYPHVVAYGGVTVPVLLTADGSVLTDTPPIVRYADGAAAESRRLYPTDRTARMEMQAREQRLCDVLGVESRRVMYQHFFEWGRDALDFNAGNAPRWERWAMRGLYPVARRFVVHRLQVTPTEVQRAEDSVARVFDEVAARLSDGRPFLNGEDFTAEDITFACMAAAVISPPNYGVPLPTLAELPTTLRSVVDGYREHAAGAYGMRLFETERVASRKWLACSPRPSAGHSG